MTSKTNNLGKAHIVRILAESCISHVIFRLIQSIKEFADRILATIDNLNHSYKIYGLALLPSGAL